MVRLGGRRTWLGKMAGYNKHQPAPMATDPLHCVIPQHPIAPAPDRPSMPGPRRQRCEKSVSVPVPALPPLDGPRPKCPLFSLFSGPTRRRRGSLRAFKLAVTAPNINASTKSTYQVFRHRLVFIYCTTRGVDDGCVANAVPSRSRVSFHRPSMGRAVATPVTAHTLGWQHSTPRRARPRTLIRDSQAVSKHDERNGIDCLDGRWS